MATCCTTTSLYYPQPGCCFSGKYSCHGMWLVLSAQKELSTWGRQELPCTWEPCKPEQPAKGTGAANAGEPPSSCSFLTPAGTCISRCLQAPVSSIFLLCKGPACSHARQQLLLRPTAAPKPNPCSSTVPCTVFCGLVVLSYALRTESPQVLG